MADDALTMAAAMTVASPGPIDMKKLAALLNVTVDTVTNRNAKKWRPRAKELMNAATEAGRLDESEQVVTAKMPKNVKGGRKAGVGGAAAAPRKAAAPKKSPVKGGGKAKKRAAEDDDGDYGDDPGAEIEAKPVKKTKTAIKSEEKIEDEDSGVGEDGDVADDELEPETPVKTEAGAEDDVEVDNEV